MIDVTTPDVRRTAVWIFQSAVAIGALLWLLVNVEFGRGLSLLGSLDPAVLAIVLGLTGIEFCTRFAMWFVILRERLGSRIRTAATVDLVIKFINHLLPSKAAGHSVAPLVLRYYTPLSWTECLTLAAANTALYAILYGIAAGASIIVLWTLLPWELLAVLTLASGVYFVAGASLLLVGRNIGAVTRALGRIGSLIRRLLPAGDRVTEILPNLPTVAEESGGLFVNTTTRARVIVPYALGWAGTIVLIPGIRSGLLLWSFGSPISPWWLVPLALLLGYSVTVLPITPGGVGIAEISASLVFVALGVPEHTAALVVLLDRGLGVYFPAMLGWVPAARIDLTEVVMNPTR